MARLRRRWFLRAAPGAHQPAARRLVRTYGATLRLSHDSRPYGGPPARRRGGEGPLRGRERSRFQGLLRKCHARFPGAVRNRDSFEWQETPGTDWRYRSLGPGVCQAGRRACLRYRSIQDNPGVPMVRSAVLVVWFASIVAYAADAAGTWR